MHIRKTLRVIPILLLDMNTYNSNYDKMIEPMYGVKRNIEADEVLLQDNMLPSKYNIHDRVDMTNQSTYSIDPDGCEDADDAFSIYEEDDR